MRFAEPIQQDAVFGHPIQNSVRSDDRGIDSAGEDQYAHDDDKNMEEEAENLRSGKAHRQPADEVVHIRLPNVVRDDHYGEQGDEPGRDNGVDANDIRGKLEILELRRSDLAIDLRQGFEAAHGQQRVAERNDDEYDRER